MTDSISTRPPSWGRPPSRARNPVRVIARKELRESLRDGRVRWLAATLLLLLAVGVAVGWHDARAERRAIESARSAERATWLDQGERNPHSAAHFGHYAFKPRPMLAALDRGIDDYLGRAIWLEAHWQDPFALRPAEDRTAVQRFGQLTAAFTLQVLAPLFVVLLGFAAVAGERERGTLRQLASLGLEARTLAAGKALGLGAALAVVLLPAALVALLLAVSSGALSEGPGGGLDAPSLGGTVVLVAVYGVYLAIVLGLVLAVSARAETARTSLVVLLGLWMMATLIVPRLVADLGERLYPIPTPRAFNDAIADDQAQGLDGRGSAAERRQALQERVLAEHGVATLEELPINFAGLALQDSEEHANLVFDKHYGELWRLYGGQERVHLWGSVLSPMLAVRALSMAIAGTDIDRHRHFADAAESHRRELVKFLNEDMIHHAGADGFGYLADHQLWHAAPVFDYEPPTLGTVLARQLPAFAALAAWLLAAVALATLAVRRLRVVPGGRS